MRPLTVHSPVPGTIRTRATASLRRPVAAAGAMVAGALRRVGGRGALGAVGDALLVGLEVSSTSVLCLSHGVPHYGPVGPERLLGDLEISNGVACWAWCGWSGPE